MPCRLCSCDLRVIIWVTMSDVKSSKAWYLSILPILVTSSFSAVVAYLAGDTSAQRAHQELRSLVMTQYFSLETHEVAKRRQLLKFIRDVASKGDEATFSWADSEFHVMERLAEKIARGYVKQRDMHDAKQDGAPPDGAQVWPNKDDPYDPGKPKSDQGGGTKTDTPAPDPKHLESMSDEELLELSRRFERAMELRRTSVPASRLLPQETANLVRPESMQWLDPEVLQNLERK